jgi:hypothetical protein
MGEMAPPPTWILPRKGEDMCRKIDSGEGQDAGTCSERFGVYLTVTVTGSEKAIRPEGPERPPGGSTSLPDASSSGSSVP